MTNVGVCTRSLDGNPVFFFCQSPAPLQPPPPWPDTNPACNRTDITVRTVYPYVAPIWGWGVPRKCG